jgi:hypothetical protein
MLFTPANTTLPVDTTPVEPAVFAFRLDTPAYTPPLSDALAVTVDPFRPNDTLLELLKTMFDRLLAAVPADTLMLVKPLWLAVIVALAPNPVLSPNDTPLLLENASLRTASLVAESVTINA